MEVLSPAQAAAVDRLAGEGGLPEPALMEAAGRLVAVAVRALLQGDARLLAPGESPDPDLCRLVPPPVLPAGFATGGAAGAAGGVPAGCRGGDGTVLVLAGPGRNGGDGLVAARYLRSWGFPVRVLLLGDPVRLGSSVADCWRSLAAHGVPAEVLPAEPAAAADAVRAAAAGAACLVDALLGTGARLPLRPPFLQVVEEAASAVRPPASRRVPVVAVDIPTGVEGDTGRVPGPVVPADLTVTFFRPKPGLLLGRGALAAGRLWLARIPIPQASAAKVEPLLRLLTPEAVAEMLPARPPDAHKGDFGHVVVVGGSVGYGGAPALAAEAALRAGAGLVTLAVPEPLWEPLAAKVTEVMLRPLPAGPDGGLAPEAAEAVLPLVDGGRTVVAGPGMGRGEGARRVLRLLLEAAAGPLVLDADALNLLTAEEMAACRAALAVTPHPGEMGRILGRSTAEVQADRLGALQAAWAAVGGGRETPPRAVILKGWRTLVAAGGRVWINPTGNEGLATAGTGDVLAGVVGGLVAQTGDPGVAACVGAFVHGLAGDILAARGSGRSLLAGDLLGVLGEAFHLLEGYEGDGGGR